MEIKNLKIIIVLLLIVFTLLIYSSKIFLTGSVVGIDLPNDCSNSNIENLWTNIFKEPYTNIIIKSTNETIVDGYCVNFEVVKYIDEDGYDKWFYVTGKRIQILGNQNKTNVIDFAYVEIFDESNNFTLNTNEFTDSSYSSYDWIYFIKKRVAKNRTIPITTIEEAKNEYQTFFKNNASALPTNRWNQQTNGMFVWTDGEGMDSNFDMGGVDNVAISSTVTFFRKSSVEEPPSCIPNWIAQNTSCRQDNTSTIYFIDSNNCNQTRPANQTISCDYIDNKTSIIENQSKSILNYTCIPSESCDNWSNCMNNKQTRNCIDINNCNITNTTFLETQICNSCVPKWDCDNWAPERCPKNETQTRNCIDINNCLTEFERPEEIRNCVYKSIKWILIGIIIICIVFLVLLVVLYVNYKNKNTQNSKIAQDYPDSEFYLTN